MLGELIGFDLIIFISTRKINIRNLIQLVCNIYNNQIDYGLLTPTRIVKL